MKKIMFILLGVLITALFLVGCAQENVEVVDEEGNIVGEAFRQAGNRVQLVQGKNLCGNCDIKNPVLVSFNSIQSHYGNGDFQTTKTASQICQDLGHKGCFAGQMEKIMHYYESTDGSCTNPQLQPSSFELVSCAESGFGLAGQACNNVNHPNAREPELGDNSYHQILTSVICFE